jgi:hypothetical protein
MMQRIGVRALLALSLIGPATAHRLDEYLQATLIGVTRGGIDVELQLTPGVSMLPSLMVLIDRNHDGRISSEEARAYVDQVARDVELRVDDAPAVLSLMESSFPDVAAMREGVGTIRLKLRTERTGHKVRFENRHLPQFSVYLVNCLVAPADGLWVDRQQRDQAQRSIAFEYSFEKSGVSGPHWKAAALGMLLMARMGVLGYRRRSRTWLLPKTENPELS